MTYGNFRFPLKRPDGWNRIEWDMHHRKVKAMAEWISAQKWDHWGHASSPEGEEFWFMVEENYMMFLLRWSP